MNMIHDLNNTMQHKPAQWSADYGMQWSPSLRSLCDLAAAACSQWYPTLHLNEN
jgi:hypothetical protein